MIEKTQEGDPQPQPILKAGLEVGVGGLKAGEEIEINVGGVLMKLLVSEVDAEHGNAFNSETGAFLKFNRETQKWMCETYFEYQNVIKITV